MFIYKVKTSTLCGHTPALCIIVDKNKHTLCLESYNKYTFFSTFLPNILMMIYKMKKVHYVVRLSTYTYVKKKQVLDSC